ncbi:unnamed protein product, partial [Nesidiocoris tenuis]
LGEVLKDFKIPLHLDGARLFNSVVYYGRPVKDTVVPCDSINICLSKGLGTPMGSLLLGNEQFIEKARILRKVIGGGMRQVGLMAAAGIYALDHMIDRLREDHADARAIAQAIHDCGSQVISVDMDSVETNILLIHCDTRFVKTDEFCRRLAHVAMSTQWEQLISSTMTPTTAIAVKLAVTPDEESGPPPIHNETGGLLNAINRHMGKFGSQKTSTLFRYSGPCTLPGVLISLVDYQPATFSTCSNNPNYALFTN